MTDIPGAGLPSSLRSRAVSEKPIGGNGAGGRAPFIDVVTLTCPGGTGAEPGAQFQVTGTTDGYDVTNTRVTVVCEGRSYQAAVNPDGSFAAVVRAYHAGQIQVTANAIADIVRTPLYDGTTTDSKTAAMPVALTAGVPSGAGALPAQVALVDRQATAVAVTVTTADTGQFGPRTVTASSDGTPASVTLVQQNATTFAGTVLLAYRPVGRRTVNVTTICTESPAVAAGRPVQTTGLDVTAPDLTVVYPHANVATVVADLATPIHVTGIAADDQSGIESVRWSLTANDPAPALAVTADQWATWSADVTVPGYGDVPLYLWATDNSGNTTRSSLTMNVTRIYLAATLEERLAERWYLLDLLNYACDAAAGQLVTSPGGPRPTFAQLAAVLGQPVDRLALPQTDVAADQATVSVNELRVPVEVLRGHIGAQGIAGAAEKPGYVKAAYDSLLAGLGTSYTQLRLARGAAPGDRMALAAQLGLNLAGQTAADARPDQLDELTLDGANLTEAALESLFGLASTQRADPLQPALPSTVLGWQLAAARIRWQAEDLHPPVAVAYQVLIDPDLVSPGEILEAAIATLLQARQGQLDAQRVLLAGKRNPGAPAQDQLGAMLAAGLPAGTDLAAMQQQQQAGADISGPLAAAGLDQQGFAYLLLVQQLAATPGPVVTDAEWSDAEDVLVAAFLRRSYPQWRGEEIAGNYVLGPESFQVSGDGPDIGAYRLDVAARRDWQRVLTTRTGEYQALIDGSTGLAANAESAALPVLRDALLADIAAATGPDATISAAGDAMTRLYQVDMLSSGALTTSRIVVAAVSMQLLLGDIRAGEVPAASGAAGWQTAAAGAFGFDATWPTMSSYGAWRSAMSCYLFPETGLDPVQLSVPVPDSSHPDYATPDYIALLGQVQNGGVLDAAAFGQAVSGYEAVVQQWLRTTLAGQPALTFRYQPGDTANQQLLASYCAQAAQAKPADQTPREAFWAVPILIGGLLADQGRYQAALGWYSLLYPYADLKHVPSVYSRITAELTGAAVTPQLGDDIWHTDVNVFTGLQPDPFSLTLDPAKRPAPFLRATLLAIVSCLLSFADAQFTAGTDESLPQARQLYLDARDLASHPCLTPVKPDPAYEPALEIPQLTALKTSITSQLTKLRQGRNIAGQVITPVLTTTAPIYQPTPYPYKTLLAGAQQLTTQAGQLESQLLNALASLDAKNLQAEDAQHALDLATAQVAVHSDQLTVATAGVRAAADQVAKARTVVSSLQAAISQPTNSYEQALLAGYVTTGQLQEGMAVVDGAIGIAQASASWNAATTIVSFGVDAAAIGAEVAGYTAKAGLQIALNNIQAQAQANQLQASIENRVQSWQMQLASSQGDLSVAQDQLAAARDQATTAQDDLTVAQIQATQAAQTLQTLRNQVTSAAMYSWLAQTLGGVYRFFLQQATATAQLAQAQLAFERAESPRSFIRADYWQPPASLVTSATPSNTYGLTGAERLSEDLATLDQYAFSTDQRRLNISQTFSLAQLLPVEFLDFRQTGQISFGTPMSWFDADFPGCYLRLIRQVRLSVVALVPPSRGIRATLTTSGVSRVISAAATGFTEVILQRDPGTIAVTLPANATGVFDTDLQPQMLLPFEGSGVDTTWSLSLPRAANPFDFSSIMDVLLTVDYTALLDYDYRDLTIRALNADRTRGGDCLFSLATAFPDQWYQLSNPADVTVPRTVTIALRTADFPAAIEGIQASAISLQLVGSGGAALPSGTVTLAHNAETGTANIDAAGLAGTRRGAAGWVALFGDPTGDWQLTLDTTLGGLIDSGTVTDVVLDITWAGQAPLWR